MLHCFRPQFLGSIPISGAPMQLGKLIAKLGLKSLLQVFGKQWVVTIPLAFLIERGQQQLSLLNRF